MGNVLMYTLLMAGITFAIGFFVAFLIKIVFSTIQRMMRAQSEEFKTGINRVRHINRIRKQNNLSTLKSVRVSNNLSNSGNLSAGKVYTNELVEYYYGRS